MQEGGRSYRAGIIGCGRIGSTIEDELSKAGGFGLFPYTHAGAYSSHPRTSLVAAADIDEDSLGRFGRRWGVTRLYCDYHEMLDHENLDIVSIATPTRMHYSMTMDVIEHAVKAIFLEKPAAQTLDEIDAMATACRSAGVEVAVNHFRTYDPYYRAARDLINSGQIGDLRVVHSHWSRLGFAFGGSHLLDLLRYCIGCDVDWVFCHLDEDMTRTDPGGDAYLAYENGVRVHIHMQYRHYTPSFVEFDGTAGRIRMGAHRFQWWKMEEVGSRTVVSERPFPGWNDGESGMYTAVDELIRAVETGQQPASNLRDSRVVQEIITALHLSGNRGQVVQLPVEETSYVVEAFG